MTTTTDPAELRQTKLSEMRRLVITTMPHYLPGTARKALFIGLHLATDSEADAIIDELRSIQRDYPQSVNNKAQRHYS